MMTGTVIKAYFDNVIVSGKIRRDLVPKEMAAVDKIAVAEYDGRLTTITSRESWREQDQTPDQVARSQFQKERPNVPVVTDDHKVLGFHFQQDQFGGFVTYPPFDGDS